MARRKTSRAVLLASFAAVCALGCSSPGAPLAVLPTLSVTNPLCDTAGQCRTIQIRAFVWAFTIPQPTFGLKVLGEVEGPVACLTFPALWEVVVRGADSTGTITDSTTYTWTPDDPDGIFLNAMDWPAFQGDTLAQIQIGATESFVPAEAAGWTMTFSRPGRWGFPYTANLEASDACVPP